MSVPRCASLKERQLVRKTRPGRIRTAPRLRELPRERENSLDGLRVLVVDDEPLIRRAVAEALSAGFPLVDHGLIGRADSCGELLLTETEPPPQPTSVAA